MSPNSLICIWVCVIVNIIPSVSASTPITGVQSGKGSDGSVPIRQDIRQLQNNNAQWNLYIYALKHLQQYTDQGSLLSYYQIAGIHGRPYTTWDGVGPASGQQDSGYCTHATTLFPPWHRPYLALIEQVLWGIIQDLSNEEPFVGRSEYESAASTFRVPFWDWAAGDLPDSISGSPWIQLSMPNGTYPVLNPLYQYAFHPLNTQDFPDGGGVNTP